MDRIIGELVAMDRQARQAVEEARRRSEEERIRIGQEKDSMIACYRKRAREQAQTMEQAANEEVRREIEEMEDSCRREMEQMETRFRQEKDRWVQEIVKRCVRRQEE